MLHHLFSLSVGAMVTLAFVLLPASPLLAQKQLNVLDGKEADMRE